MILLSLIQKSFSAGGISSGSGDKPGRTSDSSSTGGSSGGGGCSCTSSLSGGKPDSVKQDSQKTGSGKEISGGGNCSSVSVGRPGEPDSRHQTPADPNDYHCDINAYNVAIDNGIQNPGNWNGNNFTVNEIYNGNYSNNSTDTPQAGTRGYGFYDNDGDGTYDHMFFYDYSNGGNTYHVWNSDGIAPVEERDWNINGSQVNHSVYVPLN